MRKIVVERFGETMAEVAADDPAPHGREVVLKVDACGVCHSDVHLFDGAFDLGNGAKIDLTRSMNLPRVLGHEIVGTVVAVGPDAAGDIAIGARRIVFPWIGCGQCAICQAGDEHLCGAARALGINADGGFADHVVVPDPKYLLDYAGLAPEQACIFACSGLTAYAALKKAGRLSADRPLLIVGAGGVGLSGIRMAEAVTGVQPIVADIDALKADIARSAGAVDFIDPRADGAARNLMRRTGGGAAVAIDFVGSAETFTFALGTLRKGGVLICVGLFGGAASVSPAMIPMKSLTVTGSYVGSLAEMAELMAIARAGKLPPMPIATHPLAAAGKILEALRRGEIRGRAVLVTA